MEPDTAQHAINKIAMLHKIEKHTRDNTLDKGEALPIGNSIASPLFMPFLTGYMSNDNVPNYYTAIH